MTSAAAAWLPRTPAEIRSRGHLPDVPHAVPLSLTQLVAAYTDVELALSLAKHADEPHPGEGAELAALALAAEIAREASYGRGVRIRAARAAGATWQEVAAALDVTEEAAREEFVGWIDGQSRYHATQGRWGLDPEEEATARALVDDRPEP